MPGIGADLSGGPASGTLALLAAGLPGMPGTVLGHGTGAGERLLAVTFNDLAVGGREAELERAGALAANPRLHHVVVAGGEETLPYADLEGPLTDEPGASLVTAARHRARLAAGSADHFTGYGARQVLDAHPARLADLLMDRKRRHLVRPVAALAKTDGSVLVPARVYAAARRLSRTPYRAGLESLAERLLDHRTDDGLDAPGGAVEASLAALTWGRPGPAARWLTGEALAEVSVRLQAATHRSELAGPGQRPGDFRARAALARHAADLRVLEQAAEIRFQRLHAPFLDNQVVRAARALPEALRVRPGARAAILRTVLEGAGVRDLPPGWGAPTQATAAAAARTGLRVAADSLVALFDTPLLAEAGLVEARVVRKALRSAAAGEPSPWTASPTSSPWNCGCAACCPAAAPAGRAHRPVSGPYRRGSRRSGGRWGRGPPGCGGCSAFPWPRAVMSPPVPQGPGRCPQGGTGGRSGTPFRRAADPPGLSRNAGHLAAPSRTTPAVPAASETPGPENPTALTPTRATMTRCGTESWASPRQRTSTAQPYPSAAPASAPCSPPSPYAPPASPPPGR
ncbi:hypothetical protein STAFG_0435 [Streptomyces afghaniensis 772]|uniref:Asparagine synthetase domain-containing protein n=1 Tax=Streptomyces afghaniensis 772 TaxID=1283301 RepID=S4NVG0_9ACTN|nr:hypothetical protein STAFG_0435 [Streptomyces afghaniensis 772]